MSEELKYKWLVLASDGTLHIIRERGSFRFTHESATFWNATIKSDTAFFYRPISIVAAIDTDPPH